MPEPAVEKRKEEAQKSTSFEPEKWLLEEYKLLSSHYFFEDDQLFKAVTIYATINGGMLAFVGSTFFQSGRIPAWIIPAVGLALCFSWVATIVRIREWRKYIEERIKAIESHLHKNWRDQVFVPLDIRTLQNWTLLGGRRRWYRLPYLALREVPASLTLMILPLVFSLTWITLLLSGGSRADTIGRQRPTPPLERTAGAAAHR